MNLCVPFMSDNLLGMKVPDWTVNGEVTSLTFHPEEQILLATTIEGGIAFGLFDEGTVSESSDGLGFRPHKKASCRAVQVVEGRMVSGGSDGRVVVSSFDPKVVSRYAVSPEAGISALTVLSESVVVCGNDDGALIGIDVREKKRIFSIHEQSDYISGIVSSISASPLKSVVAVSGDCTLAAYDFRSSKLVALSDAQEDELCAVAVANGEQHVVSGDANGVLGFWKQGFWGDLKDRLPLYKNPLQIDGSRQIDGIAKLEERKLAVVTSDGIVRTIDIFPNEVHSVLGVHRTPTGDNVATITGFACDVDLKVLATAAGDNRVKFWSLDAPQESKLPVHTNAEKASRQSFFSDL